MRTVLSLCVIISAAWACPIENPSCSGLPKICPSEWNIKIFESQYATLALQGKWYVQTTTPFMVPGVDALKTGLFCSCFPSTSNILIFKDTTPCNDNDYNIQYEVIDQSFNVHTQNIERTRTLFSPAYGDCSQYAIFNVGTEKYYKTPIHELYPLLDKDLITHKIEGFCEREYTVAVIGADDCWEEYMVLAVINRYPNVFIDDDHLIFILTRDVVPKWSTYNKAFQDIQRSKLNPHHLISVDQSYNQIGLSSPSSTESLIPSISSVPSLSSESSIPSISSESSIPSISSVSGDIDSVIQKTSTSTQSVTKSVNQDNNCGSSYSSSSTTVTTTVQTSTVIIDINPDFKSPYDIGPCDLFSRYNGALFYKGLDYRTIREALSGQYFLSQCTPCSLSDNPDARVGMLNTAFPACGLQLLFDNSCMDDWDCNTPYMFLDRGFNMNNGLVQNTRGYIMSAYPTENDLCKPVFAMYHEGYYPNAIDELNPLDLNGMICKQPFDMYKYLTILSIIGYSPGEYLILCIANQYKNTFYDTDTTPIILCYTRDQIASPEIMDKMAQEVLRCGFKANLLVRFDQTNKIDDDYVFDRTMYESEVTSFSSSRSLDLTYGGSTLLDLPKICPPNWIVKTFDDQYSTIAFQGEWKLQMTTPTLILGNDPLKSGLFCSCFPSTSNILIFKDTTPCNDNDYNIQYEVIDQSFNVHTQTIERTRTLFSPAYGDCSQYAIFNVGTEKYYKTPVHELYPLLDKDLIRHKIEGFCEREYTVAVIGADDCWEEYMVLAVINRYENFFCGNDHIIWVFTRDTIPKYSTYAKAFEDIERSGLMANYLISVDHSYNKIGLSSPTSTESLIPSIPSGPSLSSESSIPSISSVSGDIDSVIQKTSTSTQSVTKSVNQDNNCGSSYSSSSTTVTTTVQTSTVIIDINPDFKSPYDIGPCDLYNGLQIYKQLDYKTVREAMSGLYYMIQGSPCSFGHSPDARVGMLNTAFPACGLQLLFDNSCMDDWDCNTPYMFLDRGFNMNNGLVQNTRGYIMSAYPTENDLCKPVFAMYHEGYYPNAIDELNPIDLNGMICKQPFDMYKYLTILSIIGYSPGEYLILCIANQYKNPFFNYGDEPLYHIYCYTRDRIPSQRILDNMNQEILLCGYDPNKLVKIDQTVEIEEGFTFDRSYFESTTSCWSSSNISSQSISISSSSTSSSISIGC